MPYKDAKRNREAALERYTRNKAKRLVQMRAYYAANKDKARAYVDANRATINERNRARRALTVATPETREYTAVVLNDPCSYCFAPSEHVDHIVPIIGGGEHAATNLTGACQHCNSTKGPRPLLAFMLSRVTA